MKSRIYSSVAALLLATSSYADAQNLTTFRVVKAYQFALTNPKAAVELFYKEFPSTIPAGKDLGAAVTDGVVILQAWLKSATSKLPEGTAPGIEFKERWENSQKTYRDLGVLKGDSDVTKAYTTEYYDKCNNFDRAAIIAQAKAMK